MSSSPSQGFSLVEVMVSVLFLMIAISGLMTTYTYMSSQVERTRWKRSALHIAQQTLEKIMADPAYELSKDTEVKGNKVKVPLTFSNFVWSPVEIKTDLNDQSIIECKISWPDKPEVFVSLKTIVKN